MKAWGSVAMERIKMKASDEVEGAELVEVKAVVEAVVFETYAHRLHQIFAEIPPAFL